MIRLAALACGVICGMGLILGDLFHPSLLQSALRPAEASDLRLGVGLLSAFGVALICFGLTRRRSEPLLGGNFDQTAGGLGWKAIVGGVLFGLGWGLAGYFPLTALVSLGLRAPGAVIFLMAVLGGMALHDLMARRGNETGPRPRSMG